MTALLDALGLDESRVAGLLAALRERDQTLATAESLTAGLVCGALTSVAGSSAVVRGGLIVYATELKIKLANVSAALLAEHGAVHPEVAGQLAAGARAACGADWGLGLTGVAGPDPQDGVSPGRVYVAVAGPGPRRVRELDLPGDRHAVRAGAARAVLELLQEAVPAAK
ncbi:MAG TPA: CinA family protein [Pseudonocardiaceae bacterium]|nr:CinA family protein [Pseudonocardiaceae bacterium]